MPRSSGGRKRRRQQGREKVGEKEEGGERRGRIDSLAVAHIRPIHGW